jgi:hypothetical protein
MREASKFLDDLLEYVAPSGGQAIIIMEVTPRFPSDPNWMASAGSLDGEALVRYAERIAALISIEPRIDWSGVPKAMVGTHKHITKYRAKAT